MTPEELLNHIGAETGDFLGRALLTWIKQNSAFRLFLERYKDKVRAKLRNCDSEDKRRDLLWELEVACLLTKSSDFALQYERYGTGTSRAPDYSVSHRLEVQFDAEATRIRKTEAETKLIEWESEIKAAIRAVPSDLGVSLSITAEFTPDLLRRLNAAREDIKRFLAETISSVQTRPETMERCPVPSFEDELEMLITKSPLKFDRNHTSYYGADLPVAYSQREFTKFGDIICDKIRQLREGTANILMIGSDTDAHEFRDCIEAIENLLRLAADKDENVFCKHWFTGADDFRLQFAKLSGIVFRNRWQSWEADRNSIWPNPRAAHRLPDDIWQYLGKH